jgi:uncharacterized protein (UPF0332 family)
MDPETFLSLADEWVHGPTEAHWRSAVSRAYYAAFHVARLLLEDLGFEVERGDRAHAYLTHRLCQCSHPEVGTAGTTLIDLRRSRNDADYGLKTPFSHRRAIQEVHTAHDTIAALQRGFVDPNRMPTTEAIRQYERDVLKSVTWRGPIKH